MKKCIYILIAISFLLVGCDKENPDTQSYSESDISMYIQEKEHLFLDYSSETDKKYTPIKHENIKATWLTVMEYENLMINKTKNEFENAVRTFFTDIKNQGFNTIFVHLRAYGDSYYNSQLFPKGAFYTGDYDVLEIMINEAHSLGISIHGWINPLRCQTEEEMKTLSDNFTLKKWYTNNFGTFIVPVNGRCYLNPAYEEVRQLISDGVSEIVGHYNIDGIHIDDYFYPTTNSDFDIKAFEESKSTDLAGWRLENCNKLVKSIYDSVKAENPQLTFSISPQGNINANYSSQFADVRLWAGTEGYCDYIIPQIYYGFQNESCPFEETLLQWEKLVTCESVSLIVGLAGYKEGKEDKWAGSGINEWIENKDVLSRQKAIAEASSAIGYAVYY
ncbi:MAG: hypothetical protein E7499_07775 [Ruminococcus sp.]|nr:hypothetical protein [Ruminococcus sp.]